MLKAIKLVLKETAAFDLYFNDGTVKRFDTLSLCDRYPQFNVLNDRTLFLKGKLLGWSMVYWNDELDIDTELVYEEGVDVSKEYDDIENVVLGYRIKELRLEKNLSQEDLSTIIGIDQSDLSKIEKGTGNPSLKTINRIANGLDAKLSVRMN